MRPSGRKPNQLRHITIDINASRYAEGSCIIKSGNTHVLCTASIDEKLPPFLRDKRHGWVTAEYSMLPRSTQTRSQRESSRGKQSGRTMEIQRLIARSLRAAVNLETLGERQIIIDCDVLQADGGTRTASITGGFVALSLACQTLYRKGLIKRSPILYPIAAVSCGIYNGSALLDLDYDEDSTADVDCNFVMNDRQEIIEIQGTAEEQPFSQQQLTEMMDLASKGITELISMQKKALGVASDDPIPLAAQHG